MLSLKPRSKESDPVRCFFRKRPRSAQCGESLGRMFASLRDRDPPRLDPHPEAHRYDLVVNPSSQLVIQPPPVAGDWPEAMADNEEGPAF